MIIKEYISRFDFFDIKNPIQETFFSRRSDKHGFNETFVNLLLGKPLFQRAASLVFCDEIINSWGHCSKYFGLNQKTLIGLSLLTSNIFLGNTVVLQQTALRAFLESAIKNPHDLNQYFYPLLKCVGVILATTVVHAINAISCTKLKEDLSCVMREDLTKEWMSSNAFTLNIDTKKINPAIVLVETITKFCENLITLINSRLSVLSHFIGALYALYLTATWIEIGLWGINLEIPYLIVICLIYAHSYNILSSWANSVVKSYVQKKHNALDNLKQQAHHTQANAISIAFHNGGDFENNNYNTINESIQKLNEESLRFQFYLSFLNKIHRELSPIVGGIAQLLKGNIDIVDTINSTVNFSHIVTCISWGNANREQLATLDNDSIKINDIVNKKEEFKKNTNQCNVKYCYNSDRTTISLKFTTKDKKSQYDIIANLEPRKRYRIIGANGAGKTELLKVLREKMNPHFGSGNLSLPTKDAICFLPQVPYILKGDQHSLMETIFYPDPVDDNATHLIEKLLAEFNFTEDINAKRDWTTLSLGQQQQIRIITALIKKPKLLIMDEPFASMDFQNSQTAIKLLNTQLKETTILYIWHKDITEAYLDHNHRLTDDCPIRIVEEDF